MLLAQYHRCPPAYGVFLLLCKSRVFLVLKKRTFFLHKNCIFFTRKGEMVFLNQYTVYRKPNVLVHDEIMLSSRSSEIVFL